MQKNGKTLFWSTWDILLSQKIATRVESNRSIWGALKTTSKIPIMRINLSDTGNSLVCASTRNSSKHFLAGFIQSLGEWGQPSTYQNIFGPDHPNLGRLWSPPSKLHKCKTAMGCHDCNILVCLITQLQMICCDQSWRQEKERKHR